MSGYNLTQDHKINKKYEAAQAPEKNWTKIACEKRPRDSPENVQPMSRKNTKLESDWLNFTITLNNRYDKLDEDNQVGEISEEEIKESKKVKPPPIFAGVANISLLTTLLESIAKNEY